MTTFLFTIATGVTGESLLTSVRSIYSALRHTCVLCGVCKGRTVSEKTGSDAISG